MRFGRDRHSVPDQPYSPGGRWLTNVPNNILYYGWLYVMLLVRKHIRTVGEKAYIHPSVSLKSHCPGLALHAETGDRVNLSIKEEATLHWFVFYRDGMLQKTLYLTRQHCVTCITQLSGLSYARWDGGYASLYFFSPLIVPFLSSSLCFSLPKMMGPAE